MGTVQLSFDHVDKFDNRKGRKQNLSEHGYDFSRPGGVSEWKRKIGHIQIYRPRTKVKRGTWSLRLCLY